MTVGFSLWPLLISSIPYLLYLQWTGWHILSMPLPVLLVWKDALLSSCWSGVALVPTGCNKYNKAVG